MSFLNYEQIDKIIDCSHNKQQKPPERMDFVVLFGLPIANHISDYSGSLPITIFTSYETFGELISYRLYDDTTFAISTNRDFRVVRKDIYTNLLSQASSYIFDRTMINVESNNHLDIDCNGMAIPHNLYVGKQVYVHTSGKILYCEIVELENQWERTYTGTAKVLDVIFSPKFSGVISKNSLISFSHSCILGLSDDEW